jgi:CDP-diacylglycerol--glycerol-3-phosphate 3-phosphatidyltransferase
MRLTAARGDRPGHRELPRPDQERLATTATVLTYARTIAAVVLALAAAGRASLALLLVSLAVYWVGDVADGVVARVRDEETRTGAVVDVLCDRLSAACFYLGFAWYDTSMVVPVGLYLAEFMVLDATLSLAFLAWPVNSPNYFYLVDERIWRWNWSKPAKAVNSALFAVLLVTTRSPWLCGAVAGCLFVLKSVSTWWLSRLELPLPGVRSGPARG